MKRGILRKRRTVAAGLGLLGTSFCAAAYPGGCDSWLDLTQGVLQAGYAVDYWSPQQSNSEQGCETNPLPIP
jgi:hypothetical protein